MKNNKALLRASKKLFMDFWGYRFCSSEKLPGKTVALWRKDIPSIRAIMEIMPDKASWLLDPFHIALRFIKHGYDFDFEMVEKFLNCPDYYNSSELNHYDHIRKAV